MRRMISVPISVCGLIAAWAGVLAIVATSGPAQAEAIIRPNAVAVTSETTGGNVGKEQLISNGADNQYIVYSGDISTWTCKSGGGASGSRNQYEWQTATNVLTATATFTLPFASTLNTAYLWNYNDQGGTIDRTTKGVKDFTLWTSPDNVTYTQVGNASLSQLAKTVYLNSYTAPTPMQIVTFDPVVGAKYVQIRTGTVSNWGSTTNTGLSKVLFGGSEPATDVYPLLSAKSVTASTTIGPGAGIPHLIDWGGMIVSGTDPTAWTHITTADGQFTWLSANSTVANQWVKFDLGGLKNLKKVDIWNMVQVHRGVHNFEIWGSADDLTYNLLTATPTVDLAEVISPNLASGQAFDLNSNAIGIRYVKLEINTNWGTEPYVGLSAVHFQQIPEPGTLALLAAGLLGLLAYAWRKQK